MYILTFLFLNISSRCIGWWNEWRAHEIPTICINERKKKTESELRRHVNQRRAQEDELIFFVCVFNSLFVISFFKIQYCYSITVVCLFSPSLHPTTAKPTSLPHLHPPPWFGPCVLYSSSCNPLSSLSRPHTPMPIVRLFLTSMSLVIFCFLFLLFIMFQLKVRSYGICPHCLAYLT